MEFFYGNPSVKFEYELKHSTPAQLDVAVQKIKLLICLKPYEFMTNVGKI